MLSNSVHCAIFKFVIFNSEDEKGFFFPNGEDELIFLACLNRMGSSICIFK